MAKAEALDYEKPKAPLVVSLKLTEEEAVFVAAIIGQMYHGGHEIFFALDNAGFGNSNPTYDAQSKAFHKEWRKR